MESLNLHVKDGICINLQLRSLFYVCSKPLFIGLLCGFHGIQETGILLKRNEALKLGGIIQPSCSDGIGNKLCIWRVCLRQETTVADTVCLVVKNLRPQAIKIAKNRLFKNAGVKIGNTVDRMTEDNGEICHAHLSVPQNCRGCQKIGVYLFTHKIFSVAPVYLFDKHVQPRQQMTERLNGPFLKSLRHNRMIGIGN